MPASEGGRMASFVVSARKLPRMSEHDSAIRLVGFDGDDTLWKSEDYYRDAQAEFERILASYVDLDDVHDRLYAVEKRNLSLFGYGVKGMVLSMLEAAFEITGGVIGSHDMHRIVSMGKALLQHPVEQLDGIRDAVAAIAADYAVVLITKGDLFHQEAKVRDSGLADLFPRIEIVSEKDAGTYERVLAEFGLQPRQFVMVGNSLRSDIAPVVALGGWGVHMPYHVTWAHEQEVGPIGDTSRVRSVRDASQLPAAVREIAARVAFK
jgi:putative hydrolase of the HAD superfamily